MPSARATGPIVSAAANRRRIARGTWTACSPPSLEASMILSHAVGVPLARAGRHVASCDCASLFVLRILSVLLMPYGLLPLSWPLARRSFVLLLFLFLVLLFLPTVCSLFLSLVSCPVYFIFSLVFLLLLHPLSFLVVFCPPSVSYCTASPFFQFLFFLFFFPSPFYYSFFSVSFSLSLYLSSLISLFSPSFNSFLLSLLFFPFMFPLFLFLPSYFCLYLSFFLSLFPLFLLSFIFLLIYPAFSSLFFSPCSHCLSFRCIFSIFLQYSFPFVFTLFSFSISCASCLYFLFFLPSLSSLLYFFFSIFSSLLSSLLISFSFLLLLTLSLMLLFFSISCHF